jgi:translation initiation factor 3 subunit H
MENYEEYLETTPIKEIELDSLVVLQIVKHCQESLPATVTGQILGIDIKGTLKITYSFPFSSSSADNMEDQNAGADYQLRMLTNLRNMNFDVNTVGWYRTADNNLWDATFIENQYNYQAAIHQSVVIVYDPVRSSQGNINLHAYRLTDEFMEVYKEKEFDVKAYMNKKLNSSKIFENIPIKIKNNIYDDCLISQYDELNTLQVDANSVLSQPSPNFLNKNIDLLVPETQNNEALDLDFEDYLIKKLEILNLEIDKNNRNQMTFNQWYKQVQAELSKIKASNQMKIKENKELVAKGEPPKYTEEDLQMTSPNLEKLYSNGSFELDIPLVSRRMEMHCKQIKQFAGPSMTKMFMVKALQRK